MEFAIYLEAYSKGYDDLHAVNIFENYVLTKIPAKNLKNRKKLFHNYKNQEIKEMKKFTVSSVENAKEFEKYLGDMINKYCEKVIKDNVYSLNKYLDKQLLFKFDGVNTYIVEERFLTRYELEQLYNKILRTYILSIKHLTRDAIWFGINDRV